MEADPSEASARRFEQVQAACERARRGAAGVGRETRYRFCGHAVRVRIVGDTLAQHLEPAFAHLRADPTGLETALTIDLWDERETGVAGPREPARHAAGKTWTLGDGRFAATPDGRFVSHQLRGSVAWLDRRTQQLTAWFADGRDLTLHERGKPLQMLLSLWASDRGLQAIHAALVARDGRGVLIPGSTGAGKSTTALSCLCAGFTYLGDDWAGVGRTLDGALIAFGLYSSTFLEPAHAARFPSLGPRAIHPRDASESKSLIFLAHAFPEQLGHSAALCALALPRIVGGAPARPRPATKRDALLMLAPSTVFTMRPRAGPEALQRLAEVVQQVPAYWLEIGRDLGEISRRVEEILADAGSSPM